MHFSKYHGLGNDFLVVDLRAEANPAEIFSPEVARALCDRRRGVGGDGLLAIFEPETAGADARMRILNADGSEAEMCGNGIRCVAMHLAQRDPSLAKAELLIDSGAGPLLCSIANTIDRAVEVSVDMGRARLERGEIPIEGPPGDRCIARPLDIGGREHEITAVSMGNPHAVHFTDCSGAALRELAEHLGPLVETHPSFPKRTNVEFASSLSDSELEVVVWERGCGITEACGTGACATAVAACLTGRAKPNCEIKVHLLGGTLAILVDTAYEHIVMRGPARHVFDGELDLSVLLQS